LVCQKKTSPAGGAMHATEVYPLISRVEGIAPGIYHYRTQDHALELIEALSVGQAAKLVTKFSAGQEYFAAAPVCLFFTCRFERLNYKYPEHAKAYKVAMMDVAHLSQTAYLVCTELELGACFYGAINDDNINRRLGLDGVSEGALAAFALGHPDPRGDGQEFSYEPYDPVAERRSGSR
ncbi:MAG: SagB/ThcOx family dehydrogenase, partial [Gammaproteobacteria bacterium]|nr:SagB/ThcOx family dehydrogenase [Gammaproteobacteria bacterium]